MLFLFVGNVRKSKPSKDKSSRLKTPLSTDEVLERIQQQMAEVMASAQEAANNAVTNESEARAAAATTSSNTPATSAVATSGGSEGEIGTSHAVKPSK